MAQQSPTPTSTPTSTASNGARLSGGAPIGNLIAGSLASRFGTFQTLVINGSLCLGVMAIFFWRLPRLRAAAAPVLAQLDPVTLDPLVTTTEQTDGRSRS